MSILMVFIQWSKDQLNICVTLIFVLLKKMFQKLCQSENDGHKNISDFINLNLIFSMRQQFFCFFVLFFLSPLVTAPLTHASFTTVMEKLMP